MRLGSTRRIIGPACHDVFEPHVGLGDGVREVAQRQQESHADLSRHERAPYLFYDPPRPDGVAERALLVFLHGSGERGTDLELVRQHGLPRLLDAGLEVPFPVASPQCPAGTEWTERLDILDAFVEALLREHRVDPNLVYLSGMSMGGAGTWHLAVARPDRFAAIAPVCGYHTWHGGDPSPVCAIRHVPVWAFHGEEDEIVPADESRVLIDTLAECGGDVRLTLYPGVDHNSWDRAYGDPRLYAWLLAQRRRPRTDDPPGAQRPSPDDATA
jgi:predicted peptidase